MKDKDKDRSPEKAQKRASADMRCAMRKLSAEEAAVLFYEAYGDTGLDAVQDEHEAQGGAS